jgi:hypothetical protein
MCTRRNDMFVTRDNAVAARNALRMRTVQLFLFGSEQEQSNAN